MAVLWIIALLIFLVGGTSLLVMQDVEFDSARRQAFEARQLAESGVSLAMHPDVKPDDPLLHQRLSAAEELDVLVTGEDGLINPNILLLQEDRATLRRILQYWGITDLPTADRLINNLIDWVDADPYEHQPGAEAHAYNRPGYPFNRPFRSVEEMAEVQGMELVEQAYPNWRKWFSVYASGAVDVNEAQPELLSALTGADLRLTTELRNRRLGPDGIPHTEDDIPIADLASAASQLGLSVADPAGLSSRLSVSSSTRRIVARARVGNMTRQLSVVSRGSPNGSGGPTSILWMREE